MAPRDPLRPPSQGIQPEGADVRDIDYEDDVPTGVAPRQPSSPQLAQPTRKGSTRIDPRDVFYLTDRPPRPPPNAIAPRAPSTSPPALPPPGPVLPALRPPPVRMPDPRVSTVAFPLANRRSSRPPDGPAPAPAVPAPEIEAPTRYRFPPLPERRSIQLPPLPELRSVELPPPVESRWGNAAIVFVAGVLVLFLSAVVFAVVVGFYGP